MKNVLSIFTLLIALLVFSVSSSIAESFGIGLEESPKKNPRPAVETHNPGIPHLEYSCSTDRRGMGVFNNCSTTGALTLRQSTGIGGPIPDTYLADGVSSCSGFGEHALYLILTFKDLSSESNLSKLQLEFVEAYIDWENDLSSGLYLNPDFEYISTSKQDMSQQDSLSIQARFNGYNDGLQYGGFLECEFSLNYY